MTGDDDIWVFINDKLVLDQGGVLPPRTGTINLDTLSLTPGQTYDFDLFFAERHTVQSNLGIVTNIELSPSTPGQCKAVDAKNDEAVTSGSPVTINVLSNDSGLTTVSSIIQPTSGTATISGTSVIYTPPTGFTGIVLFTYQGTSSSGLSDTAVVKIQVGNPTQLYCGLPESSYDKVIRGTNGNDNLVGTNGNDLIFGYGGHDKIEGLKGNDCIFGGDGDDKINANHGDDTVFGGNGYDKIYGNDGNDKLYGENGNDKIYGGNGNDYIDGGNNRDECNGGNGNNTIVNCEGHDNHDD
jgi:fibro-slime domain-containing protein